MVSPLLEALVLVMLALSTFSCVMLPLAISSIARKRSELSVRNVALIVPAALVSLAFIGFIAFVYHRA